MSILSSLYNGASGMMAQSAGITVIGDNIANINTIGFKASRGTFSDVLGLTVTNGGGQPTQIGLGVRFAGAEQVFTQGSFANTGQVTDMAIDGEGFFVVRGQHRGQSGQFYTRAGTFHLDQNNVLVNRENMQVMGFPPGVGAASTTAMGSLQLGAQTMPPRATDKVELSAALDSRAATPPAFNVLDAAATSSASSSLPVYDSLGAAHNMQIYFRNTGVNGTWEWYGAMDGAELQGGLAGTPQVVARGTMVFTNTGALAQQTTAQNTIQFKAAAPNQVVNFDFGDAIAQGGTGQKGSTAVAQSTSIKRSAQDGYAAGEFTQMTIGGNGVVTAAFSNGQRQDLGQIAVAGFSAEQGLRREGGTLWSSAPESGEAVIGAAGSSGHGQIISGALELSNVDLADQFVQMIAYQRGFQANSKTIQTSDDNYVTLVQLRR